MGKVAIWLTTMNIFYYVSINFEHKIQSLFLKLFFSILLSLLFCKNFGNKMNVFGSWHNSITGISWAVPVWLPLGNGCELGLWQQSAELSMSNEWTESSAPSKDSKFPAVSLQYSPSSDFQLEWMQPWYRHSSPVKQAEHRKGKEFWDRKGRMWSKVIV